MDNTNEVTNNFHEVHIVNVHHVHQSVSTENSNDYISRAYRKRCSSLGTVQWKRLDVSPFAQVREQLWLTALS